MNMFKMLLCIVGKQQGFARIYGNLGHTSMSY